MSHVWIIGIHTIIFFSRKSALPLNLQLAFETFTKGMLKFSLNLSIYAHSLSMFKKKKKKLCPLCERCEIRHHVREKKTIILFKKGHVIVFEISMFRQYGINTITCEFHLFELFRFFLKIFFENGFACQ